MRILVLALIVGLAVPAHADRRAEAAAHYKQGKAFADAKRYDDAIVEYRKAYAIDRLPSHLFNIGRAFHDKGEFAAAIEHYQKYLAAQPGAQIAKEVRAQVAKATQELADREAKRIADEAAAKAEAERKRAEEESAKLAALTHVKQAKAYELAGAYGKAGDEYRAATREDGDPAHLLDAGAAYERGEDRAAARDAYFAYLERAPLGERSDQVRTKVAELAKAIEAAQRAERERIERERIQRERVEQAQLANREPPRPLATRRKIAIPVVAAGLAAVGVGVFRFGGRARDNKDLADAVCTSTYTCDDSGLIFLDEARAEAKTATIWVGLGLAVVTSGIVLWVTTPRHKPSPRAYVVPTGPGATFVARF